MTIVVKVKDDFTGYFRERKIGVCSGDIWRALKSAVKARYYREFRLLTYCSAWLDRIRW